MPDCTTGEVAADRNAHDHRAGEGSVAAPSDRRRFRAKLLHGGPDVVEELDLRARPQPSERLADRTPDDVRFGQGCVEAPGLTEVALQSGCDAEHATLAGHRVEG